MVDRLARRVPLGEAEIAFLRSAGDRLLRFRKGELMQVNGQPADHAYFLESGWAMTFSDFPDGTRQSRLLHFPGDLVGMPSMAMTTHPANVEALTNVAAIPFPKSAVFRIIRDYPKLAGVMFIFAQQERVTSADRLCSISRLSAKGRMAFMIMDVLTRLRASDPSITSSFEMHLTRERMAEITAMTPVHASRVWSELIHEGAMDYRRPFVTVRDEPRLLALSNFVDRSHDVDFSSVLD
jgi:CRP-like cAMP-binding protein